MRALRIYEGTTEVQHLIVARDLLEETLVVWTSEMGRTPFRNGALGKTPGREHNSWNLVMWMAGGNVRGGASYGKMDEWSLRSADDAMLPASLRASA